MSESIYAAAVRIMEERRILSKVEKLNKTQLKTVIEEALIHHTKLSVDQQINKLLYKDGV